MVDSVKDLQIGETVTTTTSPAIAMVVTSINEDSVTCTWIDKEGHTQSKAFLPLEIEKEKYIRPGNFF